MIPKGTCKLINLKQMKFHWEKKEKYQRTNNNV